MLIRRARETTSLRPFAFWEEGARRVFGDETSGALGMQEVLPEGGMIRKLWVGETAKYREHILRLDPETRRNRFAGGVSDDFVRRYVDLTLGLDAVVHGFYVGDAM